MKTHIVYCHPSENSLTAKVRDAFIQGLKDCNKPYTMSDLYKQNFKTDMSESEYLRDAFYSFETKLEADVLAEQALIHAAEALVFIYPVFWTEAPAKLVGWFDRVWSYGFAYGIDDDLKSAGSRTASGSVVKPMETLSKALIIACAGNTKEALEEQGRLQSMKTVMLEDRIYDRAEQKEFVLLGGTERSNATLREQMLKQHCETAYQLAQKL